MTFVGYPISYDKIRSSNGENLLKVEYIDGSFILDKYFVGLKGKHSNSTQSYANLYQTVADKGTTYKSLKIYNYNDFVNYGDIPNWFIIIGTEIDPCFEEMNKADTTDVCNPCPEGTNTQAKNGQNIDCEKLRSTKIAEVDYSFSELISEIQKKGLRLSINTLYNQDYRASYSGSLREVLQSWCSDFGFSFVFYDNTILIYDLNSGLTINPELSESQIIEKTESATIAHTKSTACVSYVGISGEERNYSCSADLGSKIVCKPLTVQDIGALGLKEDYKNGDDENTINLIEFLCMLSGYSKTLREMVTWYDVYGSRHANDAAAYV